MRTSAGTAGLFVCLLAASAWAEPAKPAAAVPAVRAYARPPEVLWRELQALLAELGIVAEKVDAENGITVAKWTAFKDKAPQGLKAPTLPGSAEASRFQLHLFVPAAEPARVSVGSVVWTAPIGGRRYFYYNTRAVEEWLLDRLDQRLGAKGRTVPDDDIARARAMKELLGRVPSRCIEEPEPVEEDEVAGGPRTENPRKVFEVAPRVGTAGTVIIKYTVGEDGIVRDLSLATPSPHEDLNTAVLGAASLWRYEPGRLNGCAVGQWLTTTVKYAPAQ